MTAKKIFRLSLISAALAFAALTIIFALNRFFPFGDTSIVTGDLKGIYLPLHSWLSRAFGDGFLFSFSRGLGGGMQGQTNVLPLSILSFLLPLFKDSCYVDFFELIYVLKICFACFSMCLYLRTKHSANNLFCIALSSCYGLMSYNFIYAQNTMWLDNVAILPLVLLSLDELIENGRFLSFSLCVFIAVLNNYYTAYMVCLFCALWLVWRLVSTGVRLKECFPTILKFVGGGVLGAGLSAFMLLPSLIQAFESKGISLLGKATVNTTFSLKAFGRQLLFCGFTWDQVESGMPIVFCGLIVLVLLSLYFSAKKIPLRQKLCSLGFFTFMLLSFWLSPLNKLWHMLKAPVSFPFRQSFLICALMVILAAKAADAFCATKKEVVSFTLIIFAAAAYIVLSQINIVSVKEIVVTLMLVAAFFAAVMFLYLTKSSRLRLLAGLAICSLVFVELLYNGRYTSSLFEKYSRSAFIVSSNNIETILKERQETDAFCRTEKTYFESLNDPLMYDYNGLNYFNSLQNSNNNSILSCLGYHGVWNNPADVSPAANSLLCVRYIISPSNEKLSIYNPVAENNGLTLYENQYSLPFAIITNSPVQSSFNTTDIPSNINGIYSALLGENIEVVSSEGETDLSLLKQVSEALSKKSPQILNVENGKIHIKANVEESSALFISMPFENGWKCTVNGQSVKLKAVFCGFASLDLEKGENEIILSYTPPVFYVGIVISAASVAVLGLLIALEVKKRKSKV